MRSSTWNGSTVRRPLAWIAAVAIAAAGAAVAQEAGGDPVMATGSRTATASPVGATPVRGGDGALQRAVDVADRSGFDWRAVGGELVVGCAPSAIQQRCTLGAYVPRERRMFVAPAAFTTEALLEYVVLHELAHLWQFTVAPPSLRAGVMAPFGLTGLQALESGADCLAEHWGATFPGHYGCPEGAVAVVGELFAATVG